MTQTFGEAWGAVLSFLTGLYEVALRFAGGLDPLAWAIAGGALLLILLLWLLLRRREPRKNRNRPEVLISLGSISATEGADAKGVVLRPHRFSLRMTVSNLNTYAVQVLELALKTPEMDVPATAEVAVVVPPEGSVVLTEPLPEIVGEEGRLNLYFYTAGSKRVYRLGTTFALEPWNDRYKVSPLNQSIVPTKQLASAGVSRVQERAWREQVERERAEHAAPSEPRERGRERAEVPRSHSETEAPRQGELGFPDEF